MDQVPNDKTVPAVWAADVRSQLLPGESVTAWLETDLDPSLLFRKTLVVLTNQRVLECRRDGTTNTVWRTWDRKEVRSARCRDHFSTGSIDLLGADARLAEWRFTSALSPLAHRWTNRLLSNSGPAADPAAENSQTVCPSCGALLEPDETICPNCAPTAAPPPARSLYRLWRFAQPLFGLIVLGGALMIGANACNLIGPYLMKSLIDDVLTPIQNGDATVNWPLIYAYFAGFLGAAVGYWLLKWACTYTMSWVSEKLAANIRVTTYSHLQGLSLEFFGGKRTGDLMSRIGSDSDRICNFLSINALDFVTDVVMMVMTAVVLISIDWRLALATLVPFPFIAYLIQRVRFRMLHGFSLGNRAWGEMMSVLADTIPGVRVVKAFA